MADDRASTDRRGIVPPARGLRASAYAKVNLSLEILGRRADGFHEIVSVSQTISLADEVAVWPAAGLSLRTEPPVVGDDENLVRRAAEALAAATGRRAEAGLRLRKRIPLAAGLGGGSSDAATTLRLLDRLWDTRLGDADLAAIAASLGSDVPLFLRGGTGLMRGRGDVIDPLPPVAPCWLVLVCPGGAPADKTRALYRALSPDEWSDGGATRRLADRLRNRAPLGDAILVNGFDGAAARVYPAFDALRSRLATLVGRPFHLTGAGPTLYALFPEGGAADEAARRLLRSGLDARVARTVARRPAIRASAGPPARSCQ